MTEEERRLLISVAKWIDRYHYLPFDKSFGASAGSEASDVHYALAELETTRLQAENGGV